VEEIRQFIFVLSSINISSSFIIKKFMTDLITSIIKAIAIFTVTNLDDIMILTLFFAQVNILFRRRQIQ
jgi:hypothetical protein